MDMKRTLTILSAALLTTALATPLMAQPVPPVTTEYGEHHRNVETFDSYLDAHPDVRHQLNENPHLIDDPNYIAKHPELHTFMQQNPQAAEAFRRHPYRFEHREHVYNRTERRWDRRHGVPVDRH
jgi:hypothetical protein